MYNKNDLEFFLREKFLTGREVRLFVTDSILFRAELVTKKGGRFPEKEFEFIFRSVELADEFKTWLQKRNLSCPVSSGQQAEILINSQ